MPETLPAIVGLVRDRLSKEGFNFALTQENLRYVSERFNGAGKRQLCQIFKVPVWSVVKTGGFKGHAGRLFDIHFFGSDSPACSYLAGLFATDGCVYGKQVCFGSNDLELVQIMKRELCSGHEIRTDEGPTRKHPHYIIGVSSSRVANDLLRFGVTERKSLTLSCPKDVPFFWHFLRGVVDGDGSIVHDKRAKFSRGLSVQIASGSRLFLEQLAERLGGNVGACTDCFRLTLCKSRALSLFERIYADSEGLRLTRKYEKWKAGLVPMYHGTGHFKHKSGPECAHAKLSWSQIRAIRSSRATQRELSERFGVSQSSVCCIRRNRTYRRAASS